MSEADEPIAELAREIRRHAERFVNDDSVDPEQLAQALAALPDQERARVVLDTFNRLAPDAQWAVLEHAFGDQEIGAYLRAEHDTRVAELKGTAARRTVVTAARLAARLETNTVPVGDELTVGLFRESQARSAVRRGHRAESCARQVVLRHESAGVYRVIDDVFNPRRGYFVTAEYDHRTWEAERLEPHSLVRVGSAARTAEATPDGADATTPSISLEPALYPGGRFDVQVGETVRLGSLHVGFLLVGDTDVYAE